MKKLTPKEIVRLTGGELWEKQEDILISGVSIDSRDTKENDMFFALIGEVTNGHKFLHSAIENGAKLVCVSAYDESLGVSQIVVKDTFKALQNFAREYIKQFDIPFIAITGSSGKTTTKDIIAGVLSAKYRVYKTKGNLNSTTGVPLTIFEIDPECEIAVIEMSMSAENEILENAEIVRPSTVAITNVGLCHIEFLKTQENIFKAKSEILHYLKNGDTAVVNADDRFLCTLQSSRYDIIGVGCENGEFIAENIVNSASGVDFDVQIDGKTEHFSFMVSGHHNVRNVLMAIKIALKYGLSCDEIRLGLGRVELSSNRMEIYKSGDICLINDSYNANPDSMKASIDVLCHSATRRKIAVLSDMYELGEMSEVSHVEVGRYASYKEVDLLLVVGQYSSCYKDGFGEDGKLNFAMFKDKKELTTYLSEIITKGDTVLFKASRGMRLEEICQSIKEKI